MKANTRIRDLRRRSKTGIVRFVDTKESRANVTTHFGPKNPKVQRKVAA